MIGWMVAWMIVPVGSAIRSRDRLLRSEGGEVVHVLEVRHVAGHERADREVEVVVVLGDVAAPLVGAGAADRPRGGAAAVLLGVLGGVDAVPVDHGFSFGWSSAQ
jgi:hypothetical protein